MNRFTWLCGSLVAVVVAGCGGGKAPNAPSSGGYYGGAYQTPASTSYSADAPPPPAAQSYGGAAPEMREAPNPQTRPGLGTEWGENRQSHVRDVTFYRHDPDRPFATLTVHYNDRRGIEAMQAYRPDTRRFRSQSTRGGAITVSIRGEYSEPLEALFVGDRTYVIGQHGQRYSIVVTNNTAHRFEAVATVDGLDVINGRPGSMQNRGYVLMPHATLEIDGFRQSSESVAAFRFGRVGESYAAQTGDARNVGVIGLAFFNERGDYYSDEELYMRDTANPFPQSDPRYARPPR